MTRAPALGLPTMSAQSRVKAGSVVAHRAFPVVALIGIYGASVVIYSIVAKQHLLSDLFPDEMFYGKLSQSFAAGNGLSWRGSDFGIPPLWPIILSVAWHFGSVPQGFVIAKVMGTAMACTAVVPIWLLGRELVGSRLALIPAALSVLGAWMQATSYIISENFAYPFATASLASTVMALRRPGTRWIWASLGFGVVAAVARTQLIILPVILVLALVLDVLRQPRSEWRTRIDTRPMWLWIGLLVCVTGGLLAFVIKPDLTHYDILAHHASIARIADRTGQSALSTVLLVGVIPAAVALALMARRANWRDDHIGPVLVTIVATAVVLFPVVGRFEAWATPGPVDRYDMYLVPLVMVAFVMAPGRLGRWTSAAVGAAAAALLLLVPLSHNVIEEPAFYGTQRRVFALGGFFAHHVRLATVLIAIPLTVISMLLLARAGRRPLGLAVPAALVAAILVMQSWTIQHAVIHSIKLYRQTAAATQLDWVDRRVDGPAAMLNLGQPERLIGSYDLYTEFFNRRLSDYFATVPAGGGCAIVLKPHGNLIRKDTNCPPWPRYLVVTGPYKATIDGAAVLVRTRTHGTLIRIRGGAPRVHALVRAPCDPLPCIGELTVGLYIRHPGHLAATFGPSSPSNAVKVGNKIHAMQADRTTTIEVNVDPGDYAYHLPVNWVEPDGAPALKSVTLTSEGKTLRLW